MPTLWLYTMHSYLKSFSLSIVTFIAVMVVSRFEDVARFTALTGDFSMTALFLFYHIFSILPIAIPLSALIASFLLFQSMSKSSELIALRSSGIGIAKILAPLLLFSLFLSLFNFIIAAEIAPICRRNAKTMLYHETSNNPLVLLQRQKLVKLKGAYMDMEVKNDETVKNLILITAQDSSDRLNFISARKLYFKDNQLFGNDVALIKHLPDPGSSDKLFIENQATMSCSAPVLSKVMKKNRPRLVLNAIRMKTLPLWKDPKAASIEMDKRITLSLSPLSLSVLGCAFGMQTGRRKKIGSLLQVALFTTLFLICYLFGEKLKSSPLIASIVFFSPHLILWGASILRIHRVNRGLLC